MMMMKMTGDERITTTLPGRSVGRLVVMTEFQLSDSKSD